MTSKPQRPRVEANAAIEQRLATLEGGAARAFVPPKPSLPAMADAAQGCRGCDLWRNATQAVFGEGPRTASLMFVGEQPGDREDIEGHPFVGPAGQLLDRVLEAAGIPREEAYVTNAVKHFKWEPRGKRRLHQKPKQDEIDACGPWLVGELEVVRPRVLVCLGATAAQALLGRSFRVTRQRGEIMEGTGLAPYVMATVHPSAVLRARSDEDRRAGEAALIEDLRAVASLLELDADRNLTRRDGRPRT